MSIKPRLKILINISIASLIDEARRTIDSLSFGSSQKNRMMENSLLKLGETLIGSRNKNFSRMRIQMKKKREIVSREQRNAFRSISSLYFSTAFSQKCYCSCNIIISSVRKIDYTRVICIYGLYGNINYRLVTRFAYSHDAFEASGILKRGEGGKEKRRNIWKNNRKEKREKRKMFREKYSFRKWRGKF